MPQQSNSPNLLLSSLGEDDFELLRARLRPVELRQEVVLYGAGDIIDHVYSPIPASYRWWWDWRPAT